MMDVSSSSGGPVKLYQTARVQSKNTVKVKVKVITQQPEVAQGVPGR